jgi:ribonuclease HI
MERVCIYTDGSCFPNPGPGGWGYVLIFEDMEIHDSGRCPKTTNNEMEIQAVIEALKTAKEVSVRKDILVITDSMYVINCAKGVWKRKANLKFWKLYEEVSKGLNVEFRWIKSHSGDYYNDLADRLANVQF